MACINQKNGKYQGRHAAVQILQYLKDKVPPHGTRGALSTEKAVKRSKSRQGDSNSRPTHYECVALPTELRRQKMAARRGGPMFGRAESGF